MAKKQNSEKIVKHKVSMDCPMGLAKSVVLENHAQLGLLGEKEVLLPKYSPRSHCQVSGIYKPLPWCTGIK